MMQYFLLFLTGLRAAAAQSTFTVFATAATPSSVAGSTSGSAPAPSPSDDNGGISTANGICGPGFTYCGYILRDHQGYHEDDIVKAYCSADSANCAGGKTRTDPFQALYVCLPGNSSPTHSQDVHRKLVHHLLGRRQQTGSSSPAAASPSSGFGATCPVAATGNRLQLLCACSRKCLDPEKDHIGRCDFPCS